MNLLQSPRSPGWFFRATHFYWRLKIRQMDDGFIEKINRCQMYSFTHSDIFRSYLIDKHFKEF